MHHGGELHPPGRGVQPQRGKEAASKRGHNAIFCALGVFIYAGTGYLALLFSGNFLDYGKLSNLLPTDPIKARYYGMAMIELGVQITVMAVMVSIFFDLVTGAEHGEARTGR